jgi:hypothetical protein
MIKFIISKWLSHGMKQKRPEEPQSVFLEVFGDTPMLRLLDFLVVYEDFDYSMTDIARLSGVHYVTLRSLWPQIEASGIAVMTRKVGKAKLYQFNRKSLLAKKFKEFFWAVAKEEIRKELAKSRRMTVTARVR